MTRSDILDKVREIICNDRCSQYGEPEDNFQVVAEFWNTYLKSTQLIDSEDVANMMVLFKIARLMASGKEDTRLDMIGYATCGAEIGARKDSSKKLGGIIEKKAHVL